MKVLEEKQVGRHVLRYEEPGIYVIEYSGDVSGEEAAALLSASPHEPVDGRHVFLLCDVTAVGAVHPSARRMPRDSHKFDKAFLAYVGATFTLRVMSNMFLRALNMLKGPRWVHRYFDDQASARAWLLEMRREHEASD